MNESAIALGRASASRRGSRRLRRRPRADLDLRRVPVTVWVTAAVIGLAVIFVLATGVRPAYDAYGWLVWGRQAAHLHLDTSAAPSWKPLTFLFTFPYALLFGRGALWLWMVTAVAAGFAAPIFGARIAYRLAGSPGRRESSLASRLPALFAGAMGAAAVLGIEGYWHFMMIATADPMMVALALGAIDALLSRRERVAWVLLVLLSLGRPEAGLAFAAFGGYTWWARPDLRRDVLLGVTAVVLLWFGMSLLTSGNPLIAGDVLGATTYPLPGNKMLAVLRGFVSLYEMPMQIAVLIVLGVALVLREWRWLLLLLAAASWLATDIALALHGWGIAPRYMFEPAAVAVVLVAGAAGRALATRPGWLAARIGLAVLVFGWVATMAPEARLRGRLVHNGIVLGRTWARQIRRLHDVVTEQGGPKRFLACGDPVTTVAYQSILAWELDVNVGDVTQTPLPPTNQIPAPPPPSSRPAVFFAPVYAGWRIVPIPAKGAALPAACRGLAVGTATN